MTTDLDQFVKDATTTESIIEKVTVNHLLLTSVMAISMSAGNMLDQIKKHVFYGKEYNEDGFVDEFMAIVGSLEVLKMALKEPNNEVEHGVDPRLFHAIVGIATESTELLEALLTEEDKLDTVNILEELGDLNWYQAIAIDAIDGASYDNVLSTVIAKLKNRYPNKFTSEDAINRDLDKERQTLQNNLLTDE